MIEVLRCELGHVVSVKDVEVSGMPCRLCKNILRWHRWAFNAPPPPGMLFRERAEPEPAPHADAQEETAVEHVQNLRQLLVNLVQDMREAQATDYAPLVSWIDQVEAADKRALKALVQLTRAGRLLAPGVRAVRT